ncbi:hypothetical protein L226DRAFT_184090 [Lentinus tigrinus ALCF2SS1-7]|uniref:uncharacterized protein n=1 Tax=Lentinus tigrinus ALCF2SS1-7 TaxID=1328758 RepID=UPI001165D2F6|nr:hypothetical protein L226DRAFT_184090 [Lentinus tigrinus ALCF2SS1-7]
MSSSSTFLPLSASISQQPAQTAAAGARKHPSSKYTTAAVPGHMWTNFPRCNALLRHGGPERGQSSPEKQDRLYFLLLLASHIDMVGAERRRTVSVMT